MRISWRIRMRNKLTAGILLALASNYAAADELPNVLVEEQGSLKTYDVYSEPKSFKTSTQEFTQKDFKALPVNNVYEMLDYGTGAFIQKHGRKSPILASIRAG